MANTLTEEQAAELEEILAYARANQELLNGWEIDFISDSSDRFEKYGERTLLSIAQWAALRKIRGKIDNKYGN